MRLVVVTALSAVAIVAGCGSTPAPSTVATNVAGPTAVVSPAASAHASTTLQPAASPSSSGASVAPIPIASSTIGPTSPTEPAPSGAKIAGIFTQIKPDDVFPECQGDALGSVSDDTSSHETWTYQCDSQTQAKSLAARLDSALQSLGATQLDSGSVVSHNSETNGDAVYNSDYTLNDLAISTYLTYLPSSKSSTLVIAIDQTRKEPLP